jgi:TolA-binding protein
MLGVTAAIALAACMESAGDAYRRGIQKWNDGQMIEAAESLRAITRSFPESQYAPKALLKVAQIQAYDLRRYEQAEETYRLFLKLYPQSSQAITALEELTTLLYEKKADYVGAINECQRYIDSFPNAPLVPLMHQRIVNSYVQLRNFEQARVEAGIFLRKYGDDAGADGVAYEIVRSYFLEGKPDKAADEARKALAARPKSTFAARTRFLMAAALEDSDRLPEALDAYRLARNGHPDPAIVDKKIAAVEDRIARKHSSPETKRP